MMALMNLIKRFCTGEGKRLLKKEATTYEP